MRAYIKIQDGCDRFCAYCVVPYARGKPKSREADDILSEIKTLVENGYKEIVLTGINAALYQTGEGDTLPGLLERASASFPETGFRLSSIEPLAADYDFLRVISERTNIRSHFHLSLQSGCDATLGRMGRAYTTDDYREKAKLLRAARQGVSLTTDVITGFPGETDDEFIKSLSFVREMQFAKIHVFEYSAREGTKAFDYAGRVPQHIANERGKLMRDLASESEARYLSSLVGSVKRVLFETRRNDFYEGLTEDYASVRVPGTGENLRNETRRVFLETKRDGYILGRLLPDEK